MYARLLKIVSLVLVLGSAVTIPTAVLAQATASAQGPPAASYASKWDIFAGFSYLGPRGDVVTPLVNGETVTGSYDGVNLGGIGSVAYFFNRYVGLQGEVAIHEWGVQDSDALITDGSEGDDDGFTTVSGGLILRYPTYHVTPFAHALFGGALVDGPVHNPYTWGPDVTVGGGLDYETPLLHHRLAIRLVQADYEYMHADFGSQEFGGTASINAVRLSAGVVFHAGSIVPPPPVTMACTPSPVSIFPGDPVTVTATTGDLDPKLNAVYSWSGAGATGTGTTVSISTGALAPGSYTVKGEVKEGKPGKEGLKAGQTADCSAVFTVKAFEPPTVSCSAEPGTINPGDKSTITATGVSPQNRPLTYTYSVVAGTISGSGTTATYDSTGAPTGAVAITCNTADDKGNTATNGTTVTISAPYVKPIPHATALCPITFDKDKLHPTRVDNEAKACLDQVTDALKNDSTATVVVVGESTAKEKAIKGKHGKVQDLAAERAANTKEYLVSEEQSGIDASRVIVRTGTGDSKSVEDYLVPAGATFDTDVPGTTTVDESTVKTVKRKAIPVPGEKKMHKKKPSAATPAPGL
jgi:hypothetical protein